MKYNAELTRRKFLGAAMGGVAFALMNSAVSHATGKKIPLPSPDMNHSQTLMAALKHRKTSRSFSNKPIPEQLLSDLLWAAFGINRPESGKRTAPSAMNQQEIDIYVATENGVYRYDAKPHQLIQLMQTDIRAECGYQKFVAQAPVSLIFIADYARMGKMNNEEKILYSSADTGFISQNVYLFCAVNELATVVRGYVDKTTLATKLSLRKDQKIVLAQTVGYPG